ncbi:hypothetical protein AB1Y20_004792 [Prymnesium parvum]|uniref:Chromo domain-containing protein n=1 Tax=Prymnesium parvum TaxID=97485 RepID=A0AB34IY27_PRYPA
MPAPRGRPRRSTAAGPTQKRPRVERTPQTPFEAAGASTADTEKTYQVECIPGVRFVKGVRQYRVVWKDYDPETQSTWEPMENLVGCAEQIREYEKKREAQDKAAKEAALEKRTVAREQAEAQAAALRDAAAAAMLGVIGDEHVVEVDNLNVKSVWLVLAHIGWYVWF